MSDRSDSPETIVAIGRSLLERCHYLVLGTADNSGRPWTSPVYFATLDCREFFWVSAPDARHSRNIETRPEVSIVVFDSTVPLGEGGGVYMTAVAEQLPAAGMERGIGIFSAASLRDGGRRWTTADVDPSARFRLFRAQATAQWVLPPGTGPDLRIPVELGS